MDVDGQVIKLVQSVTMKDNDTCTLKAHQQIPVPLFSPTLPGGKRLGRVGNWASLPLHSHLLPPVTVPVQLFPQDNIKN